MTIGRDSWIGERATIAANIGRHCIIGAGSLVLSPVPDYCIAVGVPEGELFGIDVCLSMRASIEASPARVDSAMAVCGPELAKHHDELSMAS
ncbi:MAG: hypothetical protein U0936_20260 [Planctomycetaceae bacterium]